VLTNAPCLSSKAEYIVVTVDPKVVVKTITANVTSPTGTTATTAICASTEKILTLGAGYVGSIQWQRATTAAGPWTSIDGATSATYTVSNPSIGANYFRVKLTSGACAAGYTIPIAVYYKACSSAIPTYVPTSGLVGWWPFCGNANDESGNGNNGAPGSGVTLTTDRFFSSNAAYDFNGSGNISLTTPPTTGAQDFTISGWVKTNNTSVRKGIACWGQDNPWQSTYFFITNTGYLNFGFAYNGGPQSSTFIADNQWHHVAVKCTSGLIQLYLDGQPTATALQMNPNISGANKALGANIDNSGSNNFVGSLDDIGIWNRALTQQEITNLFNASLPANCLPAYVPTIGLVGWWPFCGNANDESGNGNDGTVNGAILTTDRNGVANKAYSFDGVNDWIQVPSNSLYDNLSEITISSWINITSWCTPNVNGVEFFPILVQYASPQLQYGNFGIQLTKANLNYFYLNSNNYDFNQSSQNYWQNSQWVNLTVTASNGIGKWFINGNNVSSVSNINFGSFLSGLPILIGRQSPATASLFTNGKLDDIAIWNRALTQSEITALYSGTTTSGMAQLNNNSLSETTESLNNTILNNTDAVQQKSNEQIESTPFDAITYPNPYENYFHIQLNTTSDEHVAIKVYDMLGKIVEEHIVQPSDLEALQLGKDLSKGEYSIVIMQAGDVVRKRLVRRAH
jgi:hypothetical protein